MAQSLLRAKMRVSSVLHDKNEDGTTSQEIVELQAVTSREGRNAEWAKWTPAANFKIWINNPDAHHKLSRGHEYYVDFIPVTEGPEE